MFLGIVLSYHGEPSLTLAVTACRILLIPACLIPNLIPACIPHPNCFSFPSPYNPLPFHPLPYRSLFPFILYLGVPSHPKPCSLPFHPSFIFNLHPVCPFHFYATAFSLVYFTLHFHHTSHFPLLYSLHTQPFHLTQSSPNEHPPCSRYK